jgi:hypothetical protein
VSLELAPRGRPRGSASVRRPPRIRSRAFSAPQRFLQARAPRPCFMPQPFLRSTPFRGFPSQESRAPLPREETMPRLPETSSVRSTPLAPLWFLALPSLRDCPCSSPPVSSTPVQGANSSPACRCPPTTMTPFPNRLRPTSQPRGCAAEFPRPFPVAVNPGRPDRQHEPRGSAEDPIAAQVWPRPLRSLIPPASPCARAEVASDTRSILSWVFTPL